MWTTATLGKLTGSATLTMRNMFVGTCKNYYHYYFGASIRKLDCSPYMFGSCRRAFFSENGFHTKNGNYMEVRLNGLGGKFKITNTTVPAKDWPRFWRSNFLNRYPKRTNIQLVDNSSGAVWTKHKFAPRPRPQKFSPSIKSFYYNSLNFSTKRVVNPPCCPTLYSFRVRWRKNLARLPEEITPEKISQISSTKRSLICCNTKPNYHV